MAGLPRRSLRLTISSEVDRRLKSGAGVPAGSGPADSVDLWVPDNGCMWVSDNGCMASTPLVRVLYRDLSIAPAWRPAHRKKLHPGHTFGGSLAPGTIGGEPAA